MEAQPQSKVQLCSPTQAADLLCSFVTVSTQVMDAIKSIHLELEHEGVAISVMNDLGEWHA